VRLDPLPLIQRVPSVPELKPGQRVGLRIEAIDYLTLELALRHVGTLLAEEAPAAATDDSLIEAVD